MKNRYLRVKESVKQRLDISPSQSPTPLPDIAQPAGSLGPVPPAARRATTPLPSDSSTEVLHPSHLTATSSPVPVGAASLQTPGSANARQDEPPLWQPDSTPRVPSSNRLPLTNPDSPPNEGPTTISSWPGLNRLLKAFDMTAGVFPPFRAAINQFGDLAQVVEDASRGRSDYRDLRATLDALLGDISQHLGGITSPKMTRSMKNLCRGIDAELQIIGHRLTRSAVRRHIEVIDSPNQVLECYRRIQGHLERLSLNANLSIWETVDELAREARLRQLSPTTSAVYNSARSEEIQRRACMQGTRQEELATLLGWARNKDGEEVYWMNGMAGTGKTTIAYSLCAELETTAELGASFFCSRLIPECRDVKLIIPSIAYQLARFSSPFCSMLLNGLKADPDVHTRILETQFENLVVKPLLEVKHVLPTDFVVVIDALDECEHEDSVGQILDVLLSRTTTSHLPIRFLLSSRPEPGIYSRMMQKLGTNYEARLALHELDEQKVQHDIETYLRAELEQVGLTSSQLSALVAHSGVLFIYASTAARYIKGGLRSRQHQARLNMILGLTPPSKNGKDRDIDKLYTSILRNAFDHQDLDSADQTLMKDILDTIICVREPLTVDELAGLLRLQDVYRVDGLLGLLRSVLKISEKSGLVATLHASFPDFMRDNERSANFHCDSPRVHAQLARSCFIMIGDSDPQFNVCALESSYLRDEGVSSLTNRADKAISSQLFYACRYWVSHLELGAEDVETHGLVHEFLSKRFLLWMEVLNLKGCMHLGSKIMQRAQNWSRIRQCSKETIHLAHDAWRFITMYSSHAVSQSTPHIYVSMLPFWPESAPIRKHYTERMHRVLQVHGSGTKIRQFALLSTWSFHNDVHSVSLSRGGNLIAYAIESSVYIVDGSTGRAVLGPLQHYDRVNSVEFSPDGTLLVSGSGDNTVKIWKTSNGHPLTESFVGHIDWVTSVCFSPDGKSVVSGSRDSTTRVWSPESSCMPAVRVQDCNNPVWSICVSPDGTRLASGCNDGTINVWDAESGEMLLGPLKEHTHRVCSLCFRSNASLASGSCDSTIRIWNDLAGYMRVDVLEGHLDPVYSVDFSPCGKQLVSGSGDETLRLWDVEGIPQLIRVFDGHTNAIWCVRFSPDGARIVSSSGDQTIRVWDASSPDPVDSPLEGHIDAVTSVTFSHEGARIVSGSNDGTIRVWNTQSGLMAVGPTNEHSDWVYSVHVSPDQSLIASGSRDETVQLWDANTGKAVGKPLTGHSGSVFSVCFSPDGTLLASSSRGGTIRLWNVRSGELVGRPFARDTEWIRAVCFSPDSLRLISGSTGDTISVWDVNTRRRTLGPLLGHTNHVLTVCINPDGSRIASGSRDATVRLWDAYNGQSVFGPLRGHAANVNSVSFSPNSHYLVSGSDDKTIRLWDVQSGQAVGSPLVGHTDPVRSVGFSPNSGLLVSGSEDRTIRVWEVADLVQTEETKATENNAKSSHIPEPWTLQDDGWVVDSQSRLLAWVPPDLHTSLMNPRNPVLISTRGCVRLDLESAKLGELWAECYEP